MRILNLILRHYKIALLIAMLIIKNDYISMAVLAVLLVPAALKLIKTAAEIDGGTYEFR